MHIEIKNAVQKFKTSLNHRLQYVSLYPSLSQFKALFRFFRSLSIHFTPHTVGAGERELNLA